MTRRYQPIPDYRAERQLEDLTDELMVKLKDARTEDDRVLRVYQSLLKAWVLGHTE